MTDAPFPGRAVVSTGTGPARFVSTAWTVVANAQADDSVVSLECLDLLVQRYWRPVYSFIRQFGKAHEEARDLTQGFFTHFVERDVVSYADRSRGKFRNFLAASVKRYMVLEHRAAERRPAPASLDDIDSAVCEPAFTTGAGEDPEKVFMRNWAKSVVENCLVRLREECRATGKETQYRAFEARYLLAPHAPARYAEIAAKLDISEAQVTKCLERSRRRFARILRNEVTHSMAASGSVDDEIRELIGFLA